MSLFGKKGDNKKEEKEVSDKKAEGSDVKIGKGEDKEISAPKKSKKILNKELDGSLAYETVVKPWITEKTHSLMSDGKYVFKIRKGMDKIRIKKAIESLYGVGIEKINMVNIPQKRRRFGRIKGKKSGVKKAIITLREGESIEFFE